jgi:hypothetical protein
MTQPAEVLTHPGSGIREKSRALKADYNFVVQLGFEAADPASAPALTAALLLQPRLVGLWVLAGALLESSVLFAALSAVLWWSALLPSWNPFDALHNRLNAGRSGVPRLTPAPAPRRSAAAMAGTLAASITVGLLVPAPRAVLGLEAFFLAAVAAVVFGRFCLGAFLYHVRHGRVRLALRTLPWGPGV